ncbi:MAG: hypothetical protein ABW072_08110 [Sedimenticola sp.]
MNHILITSSKESFNPISFMRNDSNDNKLPDLEFVNDAPIRKELLRFIRKNWSQGITSQARTNDLQSFVDKINNEASAGNVVLFIGLHDGNIPTLQYIRDALCKKYSYAAYTVYLNNYTEDERGDRSFCCNGSLGDLCYVIQNIKDMSVYVQAHSKWSFLGSLFKGINHNIKVVQELYDLFTFFIPVGKEEVFVEAGVFINSEIDLIRYFEKFMLSFIDGVVYKNGGPAVSIILQDSTSDALQIMPAPSLSFAQKPVNDQVHPRTRLVYAGQVKNSDYFPAIFGDMYLLPIFKQFINSGYGVDIFCSYSRDEQHYKTQFSEYLSEERVNRNLRIHPRLPVRNLISRLSGSYDYGLVLFNESENLVVGKDHVETASASKLFTYLFAGLPVIVSAELKYMASLVEQHGLGVVLDNSELLDLPRYLNDVDYNELLSHVEASQKKFCIENWLPGINELLHSKGRG